MIRRSTNKDLSKLNTFGMKVKAACYIEYGSARDLMELDWAELKQPVLQMGSGSNLLFCGDFTGTVMRSRIDDLDILEDRCSGDDIFIRVGAGMEMDALCEKTARKGWWGLENLSGIPGTVGASAVQNVGAYGVEAGELIDCVDCFDINERRFVTLTAADCAFAYRDSYFKHNRGRYVVVAVTYHLYRDFRPRLSYSHLQEEVERNAELMQASADPYTPLYSGLGASMPITPSLVRETVKIIRERKLPAVGKVGSAGSFFKNPVVSAETFASVCAVAAERCGCDTVVPHYDLEDGNVKIPAAWLIDSCGLKSSTSGGAALWQSQPLVIVNASGKATPSDIIALENHIIDSVCRIYGITLTPEVDHI